MYLLFVICNTNTWINWKYINFVLSTADFGIAARISDTLAKRKSFIGTPYWWVESKSVCWIGKVVHVIILELTLFCKRGNISPRPFNKECENWIVLIFDWCSTIPFLLQREIEKEKTLLSWNTGFNLPLLMRMWL